MDVVTTSLEALIQRATDSKNQCPDTAAIDAFCGLIIREPESANIAARFITAKVHSMLEWEALQALNVLDACMKRCGPCFHSEVGKFRFLNELIKLVSPKYLGAHTPEPVRRRVLELMQLWTHQYTKETKIKEAYEMLKKQGVVQEEKQTPVNKFSDHNSTPARHQDSVFQDAEKSRMLQKLLQSKNPHDLKAANTLIKSMVKEDEKRVETKSRYLSELEQVHNNAKLLSEMLDSYSPQQSSSQDLELITELHTTCQRLRPTVFKLATDVQQDEDLFRQVLAASDELGEVFDKYTSVIIQGNPVPSSSAAVASAGPALLDLSTPSEENLPPPVTLLSTELVDVLNTHSKGPQGNNTPVKSVSETTTVLDELGDIFSTVPSPVDSLRLLPMTTLQTSPIQFTSSVIPEEKPSGLKALEELDILGETLLKQSLPSTCKIGSNFNKPSSKIPMNQMNRIDISQPESPDKSNIPSNSDDLDLLLIDNNGAVPISDSKPQEERRGSGDGKVAEAVKDPLPITEKREITVKPLGDLTVLLENIKPGTISPLTVLEERGVSVVMHFTKDSPRPDVSVFVVTTTSKCSSPLSEYLFQPVVPKTCKLKLQPPSTTQLPAHNPFLPPAAITQIMLIAAPNQEPITLKFVISYMMDDDTVTEMGEVSSLSLINT
uniref:VHS domain-containing protein n=1 Tax=Clastoptera arizonana TaxID=38151 RepID=A0A1B6CAD1_9HEMI